LVALKLSFICKMYANNARSNGVFIPANQIYLDIYVFELSGKKHNILVFKYNDRHISNFDNAFHDSLQFVILSIIMCSQTIS